MCGRYAFYPGQDFFDRFSLDPKDEGGLDLQANFNVSPGQFMPIITSGERGNHFSLMRWGLVPSWAKDSKIGFRMINARADTVSVKPSYRSAFRRQRCLVPASGFYEWETKNKKKTPFYYTLKDQPLLAFAGLWEEWTDPNGVKLQTYTIITTDSNQLISPIHDRMPVILKPQSEKTWLDDKTSPDSLLALLKPFSPSSMLSTQVSDRLNRSSENDPRLIKPVS
ncbi:MAG: SOS response-associated peptidase [Candidatus Shapirobacteria bacterium]|jgi:putative SOS response-associated peptidase YedK